MYENNILLFFLGYSKFSFFLRYQQLDTRYCCSRLTFIIKKRTFYLNLRLTILYITIIKSTKNPANLYANKNFNYIY